MHSHLLWMLLVCDLGLVLDWMMMACWRMGSENLGPCWEGCGGVSVGGSMFWGRCRCWRVRVLWGGACSRSWGVGVLFRRYWLSEHPIPGDKRSKTTKTKKKTPSKWSMVERGRSGVIKSGMVALMVVMGRWRRMVVLGSWGGLVGGLYLMKGLGWRFGVE